MAEKKGSEEKIAQLQLLEQNMQTFLMQKQQFQLQLSEVASALENLKDSKKSYKIIANIMIDVNKEDLEKEAAYLQEQGRVIARGFVDELDKIASNITDSVVKDATEGAEESAKDEKVTEEEKVAEEELSPADQIVVNLYNTPPTS